MRVLGNLCRGESLVKDGLSMLSVKPRANQASRESRSYDWPVMHYAPEIIAIGFGCPKNFA